MLRSAFAICLFTMLGSAASAAVIYAPVQYQYRDPAMNAPAFYYGGSDPLVFDRAIMWQQRFNMGPSDRYIGTSYAREGRLGFNILNGTSMNNFPATYTDLLPPGINAYPHGFSVADARNAAYANVPLYFRKRDLLASAYRTPDGHRVIPSDAPGTIEIKPMHKPTTQPATEPTTTPSPILIIPKDLLNKRLHPAPANVALAK